MDAEGRFRIVGLVPVPYEVRFLGRDKHVLATQRLTPPAKGLRVVLQ